VSLKMDNLEFWNFYVPPTLFAVSLKMFLSKVVI
jgi:hypothetical protein